MLVIGIGDNDHVEAHIESASATPQQAYDALREVDGDFEPEFILTIEGDNVMEKYRGGWEPEVDVEEE